MTNIETQANYYDGRWAAFTQPSPLDLLRLAKVLEYLAKAQQYRHICDLGCGAGWATGVLGHLATAHGVDLSDVAEARRRYPHCTFETADILNWNVPSQPFDVVVSQEVIEHVPASRQIAYLRVAHDLLRPGGHLVLTTPNRRTMEAIPGGGRAWSNQPIEDWFTRRTLRNALLDAGFESVRSTSFVLGVGRRGLHRLINSAKVNCAVRALGLAELWTAFWCSAGFGLQLAAFARKPQALATPAAPA